MPLLGKRRKQEIRDKRVGEGVEKDLNLDNLNLPSSNLGSVASLLPTGWANSKTKLLQTVIDDVYGALSKICNVVAKTEWVLHKNTKDKPIIEPDRINTYRVYEVLQRPSSALTWYTLLWITCGHMLSVGTAFWHLQKEGSKLDIKLLRPDMMRWYEGNWHYTHRTSTVIPEEELAVFVQPSLTNPDGKDGYSPLKAVSGIVQAYTGMRVAEWKAFQNAIINSLLLRFNVNLPVKAQQKVKAELERFNRGANASGRTLGVAGLEGVDHVGLKPKEIISPELAADFRTAIYGAFGVPLAIAGLEKASSKAHQYNARFTFVENTVEPQLILIRDVLRQQVFPKLFGRTDVLPVPRVPYPDNWEREVQTNTEYVEKGILTRNEVRETLGYKPIEGGDEIWLPLNLLPVGGERETEPTEPKAALKAKGYRLIDPRNPRQKRQSDRFVILADRWEARFRAALMRKIFTPSFKFWQGQLEEATSKSYEKDFYNPDLIAEGMFELYNEIVLSGAGVEAAQSVAGAFGLTFELQDWRQEYSNFYETRGPEFWATRMRSSAGVAEDAIQAAVAGDITAKKAEELLRGEFGRVRAQRIARTEIAAGMNGGNLAVYRANNIEGKEWIATLDTLTRDSHVEANGQVVATASPFNVGGVSMDMPGDPFAPAAEIVNCRCTVAPVVGG